MASAPFTISHASRIATAGSCFAQHIAEALRHHGYHYLVTEAGPPGLGRESARALNYGVFSARYGNIYTARQLLQLILRIDGEFTPEDRAWERQDGRFVDPFRPQVEPNGYGSAAEVEAARGEHFAAVRQMLDEADVFVFTLGLTEAWRRRSDGAVFPLAPGVAGGRYDPARYEFVNFRAAEVTNDLAEALQRIRARNPRINIILTVSPVPLVATFENQHVLTATTYSKSVLRVAAEEVSQQVGNVTYFPSYEVITGNFSRGAYFAADLRDVVPQGVDHVMRLFFRHFTSRAAPVTGAGLVPQASSSQPSVRHIQSMFEVVCDEEMLDPKLRAL